MPVDDILAYMTSKPKRERPHELRSDSKMLKAWLLLRKDVDFRNDVLCRHGLNKRSILLESDPVHEHAISNAWGHAVQVAIESKAK